MRRFFPGATSLKSSSSVRLENILLALSTASPQELIATCTDNLWVVIGTSLSLDLAVRSVLCRRQRTVQSPCRNWNHPKPETTPPSRLHRAPPCGPSGWWTQSSQSRLEIADSRGAY